MKKVKLNPTKILTRKKPEKKLLVRIKKTGGRSSSGRISVRHRGGGLRKMYRLVDFKQLDKKDIVAEVVSLEYDPNRTAFIALIQYIDNEKRYILAPEGLRVGDKILASEKAELKTGNRLPLSKITEGIEIHNIELEPERGGRIVKSAGSKAVILSHEGRYCFVKMPSTELRKIPQNCWASIGSVSNTEHRFIDWKKAGKSRRKGRRPSVRGSAMNPVDHPHGGGEGRSPIGLKHPKTPWGKPALGVKTRKKKWTDKLIVKRRNRKKRKK